MPKKVIIKIIVIVIIFGAGYLLYQSLASKRTSEVKDEVLTLLNDLRKKTKVNFPEPAEVNFDWVVTEKQAVNAKGKGFEINEISNQAYQDIESFFVDRDFELDNNNVSFGSVGGTNGYKKDDIVCSIYRIASEYDFEKPREIPENTDTKDVKVKCGEINM